MGNSHILQPWSLTVEQQQKVAVAQYQVSEREVVPYLKQHYCGQKWNRMEQLLLQWKNNEKLTCVSEIQEIKETLSQEEEKAFIGMEGRESGDEVQAKGQPVPCHWMRQTASMDWEIRPAY